MFCKNCGAQLEDSQKFCSNCGTPVDTVASVEPEVQTVPEVQENPDVQAASEVQEETAQAVPEANLVAEAQPTVQPAKSAAGDNKKIVLQVFAGIFAVVHAFMFLKGFFGFFGGVFNYFRYFGHLTTMYKIFGLPLSLINLVYTVSLGLVAVVLLLMLLKWTKEESKNYFITLTEACILPIVICLINTIVSILASIGGYSILTSLLGIFGIFWPILRAVIVCGGVFGIFYLMGVQPLEGMSKDNIKELAISAPKAIFEEAKNFISGLSSKSGSAKNTAAQNTAGAKPAGQNAAAGAATAAATATASSTATANAQASAPKKAPSPNAGPAKLKTDRNIVVYILLTIITCGIYGLFFLHSWIQDVNTACQGDGDDTPGLLMFYLLTIVTCGIYSYVWYYKLANRLANNASRYGLRFSDSGGSILLWMILGSFLCGIGPLVAMHKLFTNTNAICAAYNRL